MLFMYHIVTNNYQEMISKRFSLSIIIRMVYVYRKVVKTISQYSKIYEYTTRDGKRITDTKTLNYIVSLKIPPAYEKVEINLNKSSKLLATGFDVKGKKQYIYNQSWIDSQKMRKYCKMIDFGKQIQKISADADAVLKMNLNGGEGDRRKYMIAIILKLIMSCNFRIGNSIGKNVYNSYGVSTLNKSHVQQNGNDVVINFRGKKGVQNTCKIRDTALSNIMKKLKTQSKNENTQLFVDDDNIAITSNDVNEHLKKYGNFSSKDFRTWFANTIFITEIQKNLGANNAGEKIITRKKIAKDAISKTAELLHHTVAICKKKYINPELIELYINSPAEFHKIAKNKTPEEAFICYLETQKICGGKNK